MSTHDTCCNHDNERSAPAAPTPPPPRDQSATRTTVRIDGMDCPTEERLIRDKLGGFPGVSDLGFDLLARRLTVVHAADTLPSILDALRGLGFEPVPEGETAAQGTPAPEGPVVARREALLLAIAGAAAIAAEVVHWMDGNRWLGAALAVLAIGCAGIDTYRKGWIALRNGVLNINALMAIAVTGAMAIGEWPEAAMVIVLFAVAELIERLSLERARHAVRRLMELTPATVTLRAADGRWSEVPLAQASVGARMRVRPGERIALDGTVVLGESSVDQAPITGESLPVDKVPGDPVYAGSINEGGALEVAITALSEDSTVARIIHAVEAAQSRRAPTQRFVDQFARIYTPAVFALAVLIALLPPLLMEQPWLTWIYRALVMLVIACPCALVISTPVTVVSGLAAAARRGILIKGGVFLENGRQIKAIALDKTGTLTLGRPAVVDFVAFEARALVLRQAASLASHSDHPVSQAIARFADGVTQPIDPVAMSALPGRGVVAMLHGARRYLGNHRLAEELKVCSPELEAQLKDIEAQGRTTSLLIADDRVLGVFAVADTVRESSRDAVAALHALGVHTTMLTGDNPLTARSIAAQVGIETIRAELLPADKLTAIEEMKARHGVVGMVGDGINDAPALARADIGFAMGAIGSDTALETADVALMDDDPRKLAEFIRLSRRTARILRQNIALALGIKAVFLLLAILGSATLWMAVFADMGASLLVVANGLRLLNGARNPR